MYRDDRGGSQGPRQMVQGNWTCGSCGAGITELPFEPDPSRLSTLKCRDCHKKSAPERGGFRGGNGDREDRGPRQMVQGNWTCGSCGAGITELPFEPDPSRLSTLKCRDCHKKSAPERGGFRGGNGGGYRRF